MRKGFTLIELLAVIVILALVALIATPIVLNIINGTKESAAKESANGYLRAVENQIVRIKLKTGNILPDGTYTVEEMASKGVEIEGSTPTGNITIVAGKVSGADLCINGYSAIYEDKKLELRGKCGVSYADITNNGGIIGKITKFSNNDTVENITINGETYSAHIYTFDGNQTWTSNKTFGSESDVATSSTDAKNMVVVKVNGDLTINSGVIVTAYASASGYGGPKGFLIYVSGTLTNNGTISMTARGAKATGQNVYLYKNSNGTYESVPAIGALGSEGSNAYRTIVNGTPGGNGINRQTGGGGTGSNNSVADYSHTSYVSKGGNGTSYSGGSGSGGYCGNIQQSNASTSQYYYATSGPGSDNGGAGGNATGLKVLGTGNASRGAGGGAGNPGGQGMLDAVLTSSYSGENGTGGLLIIYSNKIVNSTNAKIISNGSKGGNQYSANGEGGSSGGGSINIFYNELINNSGLIQASGGIANGKGGAGGNGSITIGSVSTGVFIKDNI